MLRKEYDMVEKGRIIALAIACVVCLLIMMATRSCMASAIKARKESRDKTASTTREAHLIIETDADTTEYNGVPHLIEDDSEYTTEREYITVTNILGRVVETIPVTTPEEANMPTTTLSILEEYRKNSKKDDIEGAIDTEDPTAAAETTRYIEPKTDIVLVID